ncbi:MAG: hypothetical protein Q9159_001990 [Coniocarpon cinnabarinum]
MDPLSITSSAIAIISLVESVRQRVTQLRQLHHELPGRLHAIHNEVADFEVVLRQVLKSITDGDATAVASSRGRDLFDLLDRATPVLHALKTVVEQISINCAADRHFLFRANAWREKQETLQFLQNDILRIKSSLNVILGAAASQDVARVQLSLEAISIDTSASAKKQDEYGLAILESQRSVQDRIDKVEGMLQEQSERFFENLAAYYPSWPDRALAYRRRHSPPPTSPSPPKSRNNLDTTNLRLMSSVSMCRKSCHCSCHVRKGSIMPRFTDRVLGRLFVDYAGIPLLGSQCDTNDCQTHKQSSATVEYWFPLGWFWSNILQFEMSYRTNMGPQFQLRTLRRVPDDAACVNFALNGNINGLRDLFSRGLASPQDVSETRGYSVLRWALYGKQYETCKFLYYEGADADYRPLSKYDNSARNKASDILTQGNLPEAALEHLRCLTDSSEWVDEQNFTTLHQIVIQKRHTSLEEEIIQQADNIDVPDAMGRTPLLWAAARGDSRAVALLLKHGADPNTMDLQMSPPLSYAADRGHALCSHLLLDAGAQPDPVIPGGYKLGSSLNCAARNATDVMVLKTLLDHGADIEASGVDGKTPLIHVARTDNVIFAKLLLEYSADLNATSTDGQTPLTTAIIHNSHAVLQVLLDRWQEFSSCPRLKGPHLLQVVALYADFDTVSILTSIDHFKLMYDRELDSRKFSTYLQTRSGVDPKLTMAFEDLLSVIREGPVVGGSVENVMESGMARTCSDPGIEKEVDSSDDADFVECESEW